MTQTDNPLFDTLTEEQKQQYLRWKNFSRCKSEVLTELYRKTPKSGYSCDMIIIDDANEKQYSQPIFFTPNTDGTDPMQKLLDDYKIWYDKKVAEMFPIPESAVKGSIRGLVLFNEAELTEQQLAKTWGRNY